MTTAMLVVGVDGITGIELDVLAGPVPVVEDDRIWLNVLLLI